jgi:hypothetical protein
MQSLLYPHISDGIIIKNIINSMEIDNIPAGWTPEEMQQVHYLSLTNYLWKSIKSKAVLATKVKNRENVPDRYTIRDTFTP